MTNIDAMAAGWHGAGWVVRAQPEGSARLSPGDGSGPLVVEALNSESVCLVLNGEGAEDANRIRFAIDEREGYTIEYDLLVSELGGAGDDSVDDAHTDAEPAFAAGRLYRIVIRQSGEEVAVTIDGHQTPDRSASDRREAVCGPLPPELTAAGAAGIQLAHLNGMLANVRVVNHKTGYTQTFFTGHVNANGYGASLEGWQSICTSTTALSQDIGRGALLVDAADEAGVLLMLNGERSANANRGHFAGADMLNYTVEFDAVISRMYGNDGRSGELGWTVGSDSDTRPDAQEIQVIGTADRLLVCRGSADERAVGTSLADGRKHRIRIRRAGATLSVTVDDSVVADDIVLPPGAGGGGYVGFRFHHIRAQLANVTITNDTTGFSQTFFTDEIAPATTYYVSSSDGDDDWDGRSPLTPFRSERPVNRLRLQPGDSVLFKRGDVFAGAHLKPVGGGRKAKLGWIEIGAYGEGSNPLFRDGGEEEAAISLAHEDTTGAYIISNIDVAHYLLGIAVKKTETTVFDGLLIRDCSFYHITTNAPFRNPANLPEGAPLAWGLWLRHVRNAEVVNVRTDRTDSPVQVVGNLVTFDRFEAFDSRIQGLMLYSAERNTELGRIDGQIVVQNSRILKTGEAGAPFGTTGVLIENTRDTIMKNVEIAYTVNNGHSYDAVAFDWEQANVNCIIDGCYAHDNDGAFLLAMEHEDSQGFSRGNVIKNCLSVNNGRRDVYAEPSFIAHSSYKCPEQTITVRNCTDIGMPGSVPYAIERVLLPELPPERFDVARFTSGSASVYASFDEDGLDAFVYTPGVRVANSHLHLAADSRIRTTYRGSDYTVSCYLKGQADLVFLSPDERSGYVWQFAAGVVLAGKRVDGRLLPLKAIGIAGFDPTGWFRIRVEAAAGEIKTYLNEAWVDTLADNSFADGAAGLEARGEAEADEWFVYRYADNARQAVRPRLGEPAPGGIWTFIGPGSTTDWLRPEQNWTHGPGIDEYLYAPFTVGHARIVGPDAYLQKKDVSVDVSGGFDQVNIMLYNATTSPDLTVEFSTGRGDTWHAKAVTIKAKSADVYPFDILNPCWQHCAVDMSGVPAWQGVINGFRLRFGGVAGTFSISRVVIAKQP